MVELARLRAELAVEGGAVAPARLWMVALNQVQRGNRRGALKQLLRSAQWLRELPDECQGLDVARLRADVQVLRAELSAEGGAVTPVRLWQVGG